MLAWLLILAVHRFTDGSIHPFTVADLLDLDRISAPVVNQDSSFAAFTVDKYNQINNSNTQYLHSINLESNHVSLLLSLPSIANVAWLSPNLLIFSTLESKHETIYYTNLNIPNQIQTLIQFPIPVSGFKISGFKLAFFANAYTDGSVIKETPLSFDSALVYDQLFVRHWDKFVDVERRSQIFILDFEITNNSTIAKPLSYRNIMKGSGLETPVPPFGGVTDYDFSTNGKEIAFSSRPFTKSMAWSTNTDIYIVSTSKTDIPISISSENKGYDTYPVYSPNGKYLAWLEMAEPQYESDLFRIVLYNLKTKKKQILTKGFDRRIDTILFSLDSKFLYCQAQEFGMLKVFRVKVSNGHVHEVISDGHNSGLSIVQFKHSESKLLIFRRATSTQSPEIYTQRLDETIVKPHLPKKITAFNDNRLLKNLLSDPEIFWFKGFNNEPVQGFFYKPLDYSSSQRYPLAFLIHGGPHDSWSGDFSFRWNPQVWAGAGFAVVAINFHGSSGYGKKFERTLINDWGGAPYDDLMMGLDYILKKYSFIDESRVCALGASYGGYMVNWINGHTDRFACIVNHDGIFDTKSFYYSTEEVFFPEYEFSGPPYKNSKTEKLYSKNSPSTFVKNWKTPTLVIHGNLDYRIGISEGLSTFTALQRQGVPSRFLYFPDENHWILKDANTKRWYKEVLEWCEKWTSVDADEDVLIWRKRANGKNVLKFQ